MPSPTDPVPHRSAIGTGPEVLTPGSGDEYRAGVTVQAAIPLDDGPAATTSLAWATWALFAGFGFMLTGAGMFATLVGVRADLEGFPTAAIGLIGASYYAGFLIGSRVALSALGKVGHIRVFAALASLLAAAFVGVGLFPNVYVWTLLRFITGLCLAGQYVVAESWLNQLVDNSTRGRLLAIYGIVTIGGFALGQVLLGPLDPQTLTGFAVAAMLVSLAVAPVSLSEDAAPPPIAIPERMPLRELLRIVPTGVVACLLVGLAHGAYFGFSAVYAARAGLGVGQVGRFVAVGSLGSVLLQFPISAASDDVDRRAVGVLAALSAAGAAAALAVIGPYGWRGHLLMLLLGGTTYPLYSIAGAYTSDWLPPERMTAAASQLVLLFGAGAMAGPLLVSLTMRLFGTDGFAWTTMALHVLIAGFLVVRMMIYRSPITSKPVNDVSLSARVFYIPATVVSMGRRIRETRTEPPAG